MGAFQRTTWESGNHTICGCGKSIRDSERECPIFQIFIPENPSVFPEYRTIAGHLECRMPSDIRCPAHPGYCFFRRRVMPRFAKGRSVDAAMPSDEVIDQAVSEKQRTVNNCIQAECAGWVAPQQLASNESRVC
jgi:hypothetical protein